MSNTALKVSPISEETYAQLTSDCVVKLTQSEYDALPTEIKYDGRLYMIVDNPSTAWPSTQVAAKSQTCSYCGATLKIEPWSRATECAYCGAKYSVFTKELV